MEYTSLTNEIFKYITSKSFFKKYDALYNRSILESISYNKAVSKFNVGLLFLLLQNKHESSFTEKDIAIAGEIQLIFLAADLYDNYFDQDKEELFYMSNNNLVLLATEILTSSLSVLSSLSYFSEAAEYLQIALEGEFFDVNSTIFDENINEEFYFEKILKKSIGLFQFVFAIGDYENFDKIWKEFAEKYAIFLQLGNDFYGVKDEKNSDITLKRVTFPLLKFSQKFSQNEIKKMNENMMKKEFAESGVLEYNLFIHKTLFEECLDLLKSQNVNQEIINYLRLGEN